MIGKYYNTITKSSCAVLMAWGLLCLCTCLLTSCSESNDTVDEYENWQQRNDTYFSAKYQEAKDSIAAGNDNWQLVRVFSKVSDDICSSTDYVVAHVIDEETYDSEEGTDIYDGGTPEYTDSVLIHYRAHLIPSVSYPKGFQFESTWLGDYNISNMIPARMKVSGLIVGLSSALMQMHVGDRWELYIPYRLGYNATATSNIPAYSTLIFDVTLHAIGKPGKAMPTVR